MLRKVSRASGLVRPQSATHFPLTLLAVAVGLGLLWALAPGHHSGALHVDVTRLIPYTPLLPCLGIVVVIGVAEWVWPALRGQRSADWAVVTGRPRDLARWVTRTLGFIATLSLIAGAYRLFPEYAGDFYAPYWLFLRTLAPFGVLVPLYFWWVDARALDAHDEYLAFGRLVCGQWRPGDRRLLRRHCLGWTVKAFFLPLMTVYLANELSSFFSAFSSATVETMPIYQVFYHLSYMVDLLYCVVGYTAAIRLFDSQIRSVEPTVGGWVVALVCYQPFYSVIGKFYLQYDDGLFWDNWLSAWPVVRGVWAALIIVLTVAYALCTVSFGLRFSNLTHRGIITAGPYRFTKHPAYLAKNLSWWLISVPFVSDQGWGAAVRNCGLLLLLNGVYYLRARTEERHLSHDPTYVAYALWINEHGMLRKLGRAMPWLRYREPAGPVN